MFYKKGHSGGFFKKAVDAGHLGVKVLSNPLTSLAVNTIAPGSAVAGHVAKVSGVLQKLR